MQPLVKVHHFDIEAYRADMNALLAVCNQLRRVAVISLQYAASQAERARLAEVRAQFLNDENQHLWTLMATEMENQ